MKLGLISLALTVALSFFSSANAQNNSPVEAKAILERNGCNTCHSIQNKGGCLAPPFDGISKRRSKDFILSRITNSPLAKKHFEKIYPETELMPHPRISSADAKKITDFLINLEPPKNGYKAAPHVVTKEMANIELAGNLKRGRLLFFERGCSACHSVGGIGGQFAPRLDGVGKREGKAYLVKKMTAAELLRQSGTDEYSERGTTMPPSNLNKQDMADISEYLMSLPAK